jgi:hypothetical protein
MNMMVELRFFETSVALSRPLLWDCLTMNMMVALRLFETSVAIYQSTWRNIAEDFNVQIMT